MTTAPFDPQLFLDAQQPVHEQALAEIRNGRKQSHWMWYVFPQVAGITERHGRTPSSTTVRYSLADLAQARAYLGHPVLRARYEGILSAATDHITAGGAASYAAVTSLFGSPDNSKFVSSLTLFETAARGLHHPECARITEIAEALFSGEVARCPDTPVILGLSGH